MKIPEINNPPNSSPVEEMKHSILSFIRDLKLDKGNAIPTHPLIAKFVHLNPKQKDALFPALEALVKDCVLEKRDDKFFLTELGRDQIY